MSFSLDKIFLFNPFSKFFRASRPEEEKTEDQEIRNSVGVSQEQIDLYNYINYDYLMSNNSAVTFIGVQFEQYFANKHGRIQKYKEMALYPEISDALDFYCDDAIVNNTDGDVINLDIIEEMPSHVEEEIRKIWDHLVADVFAFNERGWDLFRKWLTEAELYIELILNDEKNDIVGIKLLPSHTMMPVYQENKIKAYMQTKIGNPNAQDVRMQQQGSIMFDKDQIAYVNFGLYGANMLDIRGYLESAIRTYNQLKTLEDSLVIYRLCLDGESRVKTNDGYKYIKDIKVGDMVYSYNKKGELEKTKVTKFWNQGVKKTVKVRSRHNEIICTPDHPILVNDNETGKVNYVEAGKLIISRHQLINASVNNTNNENPIKVKIPTVFGEEYARLDYPDFKKIRGYGNKTYKEIAVDIDYKVSMMRQFLKGTKPVPLDKAKQICKVLNIDENKIIIVNKYDVYRERVNLPEYVDEDFARLFGFLLGDGTVHNHNVSFSEGEWEEVNKKYSNLLIEYFGKCAHYNKGGISQYGKYTVHSKVGVKVFESLGYIHGTKNKRIPSWVFNSTNSIKEAFIEGFSDADGCEKFSEDGTTWMSNIELANKKLVEDIKEVWGSLGYSSGLIRHRLPRGHWSNFLKLYIQGGHQWSINLSKFKLNQYENVVAVEPVENREVYDIEVENENHNFLVSHCPVSNCRAPERRIWNIAVGRMPKGKAEEYLKGLIQRYKKKVIYNAETGSVDTMANIQSMTEDFWFTKNENGESSTVETLQGGTQLGEMTDVNYFLQKLYKTLKLPKSRWSDDAGMYSSGKSGEILREEVKFTRFVERLQSRFKYIILTPFITLLRLKGIDERYVNEDFFNVTFTKSNLFKEYREIELTESKLSILGSVSQFIYDKNSNPAGLFAKEFVMKKFVMLTQEDMEENDDLKKKEELTAPTPTGNEGMGGGFGGPGVGGLPTGGEFGGGPGATVPGAVPGTEVTGGEGIPPTGGAAPATPGAPAPTGESFLSNMTDNPKDRSLFTSWQHEDKTIQTKYRDNSIIPPKQPETKPIEPGTNINTNK